MTYPVEQNVPDDFQDALDLPEPGTVDQGAVDKANTAMSKAKANLAKGNATLKEQQAKLANLKKAAAKKGLSAARKKSYTQQIAKQNALVKTTQKSITTYTTAQTTAQNSIYEARGQFDKLLKGENRDAYLALKSLFGQYGLGSLAGKIYDYVKQGYGADTIGLLLQDTSEYKKRFAANEARTKAGLPVLAPAEYLSAESAYRQILSSAGLPKGFYDNPADFTKWISDDVSPTEIKSRVDMAVSATSQANPEYKNALFKMYGINEADLTAYFLDRKRAEPILKKQAAAGAIGAAAIRRGFAANVLDLEGYATLGITADQAEQAYGQIAEGFESMLGIAGRYGSGW